MLLLLSYQMSNVIKKQASCFATFMNLQSNYRIFLNITMWAGVPSEPLCLHTQSLATAQLQMKIFYWSQVWDFRNSSPRPKFNEYLFQCQQYQKFHHLQKF
eukprot:TRINITY_DN2430_c0_g1_i12.p4 TRINITY_DN2430_c0_g1~~TRINITY_DN2430_c0_g1_i12.p4  ORF type:complete len:101 (+),score=2.84 TRINITY_DN2430_c0_g1_i12:268-570(+)